MIRTGSDFSGVGAFDYAIERVATKKGFKNNRTFACDMDKFARQSYIACHGEPVYYPKDVYDREIPTEPLDIYMTSPPCQAFSLAGKRLGKEDKRGVLFFNSHEFIQENKPRFFIFENVKGLLSDDNGNTFSEWINMLGGKSVNGLPILFPYENSVPYHIYWKVLNAKKHGVPQNRERVFIIEIKSANFSVPNKRQNGRRFKQDGDPSFTLTTQDKHGIFDGYCIRRLTPLECFRLMAFPDEHVVKCRNAGVSDSQLYKQAGNSIVVDVLEKILDKLNLKK